MAGFWLSAYAGWAGTQDACYEDGQVWLGAHPSGSADAAYEDGRVWLSAYAGWAGTQDACYEDGQVWLGAYPSGSADACYENGQVWLGAYPSGSADASYDGSDDGAAAATVLLLLHGQTAASAPASSESRGNEETTVADSSSGGSGTSNSSRDDYYSTESAPAPPPPPPPPPSPDPRALQLARAAAMSGVELQREIDLRTQEEVARIRYRQYTPHSPSAIPLVTSDDLIWFTVLDKEPFPRVVWMADEFFKQDTSGWGHFARLFVEGRAAADPMIREALEGLREQGNLGRWRSRDRSPEWSLSEYVRDLRNTRRERRRAADEARRREENEEAMRRASTPGRQLLRFGLALIGKLASRR